MLIAMALVLFISVTVAMFCFGAAVYAPASVIVTRLRALGWHRPKSRVRPALKERIEQAMDPLSRAIPLTPSEVSRTRGWLIQAGYREPRHLTLYVGSRVFCALLGLVLVVMLTGFDSIMLM